MLISGQLRVKDHHILDNGNATWLYQLDFSERVCICLLYWVFVSFGLLFCLVLFFKFVNFWTSLLFYFLLDTLGPVGIEATGFMVMN